MLTWRADREDNRLVRPLVGPYQRPATEWAPATGLVDRKREIEQIGTLLRQPSVRLQAVCSPHLNFC